MSQYKYGNDGKFSSDISPGPFCVEGIKDILSLSAVSVSPARCCQELALNTATFPVRMSAQSVNQVDRCVSVWTQLYSSGNLPSTPGPGLATSNHKLWTRKSQSAVIEENHKLGLDDG